MPGELLTIKNNKIECVYRKIINNNALCLFEYIYFANEDSKWNNISIKNIRTQYGKQLAYQENNTSIKYFNHAFLIIEGKKFKFATDPWAIGPAFNNGWWLKNKTEINWLKELNSCDFIYISHNHPDHLNLHTLRKVDKNKVFIIPKFQHDSKWIWR